MKTSESPMSSRGLALIDCLAYIALLALILGMAFAAFYRVTENANGLTRNAADIVRALRAGEQWREDIRSATQPPRLEIDGGSATLHLPQAKGAIVYAFRKSTVFRQTLPNTNWEAVLPAVKASVMQSDPRPQVAA